jgi:hypothetical protein
VLQFKIQLLILNLKKEKKKKINSTSLNAKTLKFEAQCVYQQMNLRNVSNAYGVKQNLIQFHAQCIQNFVKYITNACVCCMCDDSLSKGEFKTLFCEGVGLHIYVVT